MTRNNKELHGSNLEMQQFLEQYDTQQSLGNLMQEVKDIRLKIKKSESIYLIKKETLIRKDSYKQINCDVSYTNINQDYLLEKKKFQQNSNLMSSFYIQVL